MPEGILHLCRKHDSYTCRALLRIFAEFVGNIPTLLNFVRKIPTHGTKCKTSSCSVEIIPTSVEMIPTSVGIIPTSVGIVLTNVEIIPTLVGIIPTQYVMCRNFSYKIQQCGNISYKISQCFPTRVGTILLTQG